jgi:hypothetical protein
VRLDRKAIEREVARHDGVSLRIEQRGKHFAAVLNFGERSRFVILSASHCDRARALKNQIADVRREIRNLKGVAA